MIVAVIGATGKAGKLIAREARARGHVVYAVTRPASIYKLEDDYPVIPKDIFELTTEDFRGFDIVVDAFGTDFSKPGNEYLHQTTMEHLIQVMEPLPETRFFVVGGAGSLFTDESRTARVYETMSPAMRAVPENQFAAWNKLKDSKVNYTFMSPAELFDPSGPRSGSYTLGTDVSIKNSVGRSYITYADFALAMVDEFENRKFEKARFTAVGESRYKNDGKNVFRIGGTPFMRAGSFFGVFARPHAFGSPMTVGSWGATDIYIGSYRGTALDLPFNELFPLYPVYGGKRIPFAVMTTPVELIIRTTYGNITFCWPEADLLYIRSENGLGLLIDMQMEEHQVIKPRGDKAWELAFRWICSFVLNPLKGYMDVDAPWDYERNSTPVVKAYMLPDADGEMLIALEEFEQSGCVRESYPSWEEGLADVAADWEAFLNKQPQLPEKYADERIEAAYNTWSHLVHPSGRFKRWSIYMSGMMAATSWQMCENAAVLKNNLPLAMDLLLNMLDEQSPRGQLPDFYDDSHAMLTMIKPPIQGWALDYIMRERDLATEVPREQLIQLYEGYVKWADWFLTYRDDDHDGVPQYEHGDETGNDDSAVFRYSNVMDLPDLSAFVALLYDKLSDIAVIIGRDDEAAELKKKSRDLIDNMIKIFWNGERFIGRVHADHDHIIDDTSLFFYRPIVLGDRLPKEIIDKMAEDLSKEGLYLTPCGLSVEAMISPEYSKVSFGNGGIATSENMLIATGLYYAGQKELAKEIARRYIDGVKMGGSPFYGVRPGIAGSWPAAGFQFMANLAYNL